MSSPQIALQLDGTIVAESRLGEIDAEHGRLRYVGYDVVELAATRTWEQVVHLLWYNELPAADEQTTAARLRQQRRLSDADRQLLTRLPVSGHAIDVLRALVSLTADQLPAGPMRRERLLDDAFSLTARLPLLLAGWARLRDGRTPLQPDDDLPHAAAVLQAFSGQRPGDDAAAAFNSYLILLAEHGLNVSTFAARVAASTQTDYSSAITAALATLKGVSHGGANEAAARQFLALQQADDLAAGVTALQARGERLMGVGHRIYQNGDPRVAPLRAHSARLAEHSAAAAALHRTAEAIAAYTAQAPYFVQRRLYPNVEFYSAPLLYALGLPLDCFTAAFAIARMAGWTAHIGEQLSISRLMRPEAAYIGPPARPLPAATRH
jgi:citrate synthase